LRVRFGVTGKVVTSDDPSASAEIARFASASDPWLIAVRMVSEGVDIPRLRVGVYATTTATELFFRQAVGRLVRWTRGVPRQRAWLFIPDDPRLRSHAGRIAEQRRHSLRRQERDDPPEVEQDEAGEAADDSVEQLSLFAVISAVATDAADLGDEPGETWNDLDEDGDDQFEVVLAPPPPLAEARSGDGADPGQPRHDEKRRLRDANAAAARELARRTRLTHAEVNAELNRRAGVRRVSEATLDQLEARLDGAERWLETA
jgi:superfamily II DNA or RNA helicase